MSEVRISLGRLGTGAAQRMQNDGVQNKIMGDYCLPSLCPASILILLNYFYQGLLHLLN